MAGRNLAPFDPARDFVVRREGFFCGGRRYHAGDPFYKRGLTDRQLRLFYEQAAIGYADQSPEPAQTLMASPDALEAIAARAQNATASAEVYALAAKLQKQHNLATLKEMAEARGLDPEGTKAALARRIAEADADGHS